MKALTLHQPWASLMAAKVKTIETRSWKAPQSAIGERVLITAAKRPMAHISTMPEGAHFRYPMSLMKPDTRRFASGYQGSMWPDPAKHPLGMAVASGVLTACVPITWLGYHQRQGTPAVTYDLGGASPLRLRYWPGDGTERDVSDQAPYGIFCYERWAWIFDDLVPVTERCPACWGKGMDMAPNGDGGFPQSCSVCRGDGSCAPFSVRGKQRLWDWEPA